MLETAWDFVCIFVFVDNMKNRLNAFKFMEKITRAMVKYYSIEVNELAKYKEQDGKVLSYRTLIFVIVVYKAIINR